MDLAYLLSFAPAPCDLAIIALLGTMLLVSRLHLGSSDQMTMLASGELEIFLVLAGLFLIGFQVTWIIARLAGTA